MTPAPEVWRYLRYQYISNALAKGQPAHCSCYCLNNSEFHTDRESMSSPDYERVCVRVYACVCVSDVHKIINKRGTLLSLFQARKLKHNNCTSSPSQRKPSTLLRTTPTHCAHRSKCFLRDLDSKCKYPRKTITKVFHLLSRISL